MGDWQRCPSCRYIRHVNDNRRARQDTCPRCGACYDKAALLKEKERRRRSFRAHRNIRTRPCPHCREPVSVLANECPLCEKRMGTPAPVIAATILLGFSAMTAFAWYSQRVEVTSPYPGISDTHFQRCIALSVSWVEKRAREGDASRETIDAQNAWHAQCSRKALRDIARNSHGELPKTPQEWLRAVNG